MITTLKNNSRKKNKTHFNRKGIPIKSSNIRLDELLKVKATPKQLFEIRKKVKEENRKSIIQSIILIILIFAAFYFVNKFLF